MNDIEEYDDEDFLKWFDECDLTHYKKDAL